MQHFKARDIHAWCARLNGLVMSELSFVFIRAIEVTILSGHHLSIGLICHLWLGIC